jgi:hypothetical protein
MGFFFSPYMLIMTATTLVSSMITLVITNYAQMRQARLQAETARRTASGDVGTSSADTVFREGQNIISWQDRELERLRKVEEEYRKCRTETLALQAQVEELSRRTENLR